MKALASNWAVMATVLINFWLFVGPASAGSCGAAKLCCQGRDSGCVIQKASPNAIIESPRDKPCYCDHACLRLGDCCDDFNETCAVTDCSVSEWSEWSECDNMCGLGLQTRRRHVVRAERNGGKACPTSLEQTLTCQNYGSCRRRARHFQVEELGPEAAANLSSFTTDSSEATLDSNFVPQITRGYCTAFTILKISRGCRRKMESFHEGSRVCVWCREANPTRSISSCQLDSPSFSGIGRWELMNSLDGLKHCHGKWIAASLECGEEVCKGRPKLGLL
ncbi:somatomedin-B and thrombospondin type-1 domain-containing protein isoform X1 [Nasonia vitripennis]|uniref:SMB domain-containing protein n=1 Tax=Nasonia vitripennis TaxID=7425 RepID=A0A7M7G614_NASVI|nr:somatomedin-B and thrombospondin type-1 domain-containing protein isoform X1 [Nasonia vitripennis]XP_016840219.1 somatomedin-B and thrombospondin type-1 domain-containing protein isoform X1 [Nasonia vitripennis]XP_031781959.1 somatomedin-B and thrombospondin type-1 domain-containing protein isoform X1 [Nasonia vitripennis]XP_031781960.1 somatomedin-B and thrombospondin type-1 domain-containing protein isoform X1 [Nasonia vitripennis]